MDVRITPNGGSEVYLCMLPESIKFGGAGKFMSYAIIALGDVKVPRGSALDEVSWDGTFPGKSRKGEPFVKEDYWQEPKKYVKLFRKWRDNGTKVNVTVSGTGLNMDMYVEKFDGKYTGGHGDFEYSVKFVEAQEVTISTVGNSDGNSKNKDKSKDTKPRKESKKKKKETSKAKPSTRTYTVKSGDCLWRIAQSMLGSGSRYTEIYNLNKNKISDPNLIYPGQVLTVPAK